jgi:hypothetical protein
VTAFNKKLKPKFNSIVNYFVLGFQRYHKIETTRSS